LREVVVPENGQGWLHRHRPVTAVLFRRLKLRFLSLPLLLGHGLVDLDGDDLLEALVDLALAEPGQAAIFSGDVPPQEEDEEERSEEQWQEGEDPDDESEEHTGQDDGLTGFLGRKSANLIKEVGERGFEAGLVDLKPRVVDRVEGHCVDGLARPGTKNSADPRLKAEEGEEGNVLGALFTLGELRKDQESLPTSAVSHPNTLQTRSQAVQEAFGHAPSAHDCYGTEVLIGKIGKGKKDADGEDPFRDVERDELGGLNLRGPSVEGEKLVGGEHVNSIDGERDK
jgi:hypothetical protein